MRTQYHFWPAGSGTGYDAWDVHRLIELTAGLPVRQVPLAGITELDTDYWSDAEAGPPTVRKVLGHLRMILDVDPAYPVILGPDGRVMDGMHRICRAILDGRSTIAAVVLAELPPPDHRNVRPEDLPYPNP